MLSPLDCASGWGWWWGVGCGDVKPVHTLARTGEDVLVRGSERAQGPREGGTGASERAGVRGANSDCAKQDGETIVFAFRGRGGSGRDSEYLTDRRILIRDVKGLTGSKTKYKSIPYSLIKAYSVSTVGGGTDTDCELEFWVTGGMEYKNDHIEFEFAHDRVDLFALKQFLNLKVLPREQEHTIVIPDGVSPGSQFQADVCGQTMSLTCPPFLEPGAPIRVTVPSPNPGGYTRGPKTQEEGVSAFFSWLGDDGHEVDRDELQERLRTCPPVLAPDEQIELAYKSGRDFIVFSTKRIMIIDRRGITGKKVKSKRCPLAFFRPYSTLASDI